MTCVLLQENWTSLSAEAICPSQILSDSWHLSKQIPKVIDCELVKKIQCVVCFNFTMDVLVVLRLIYFSSVF